jgi:hypothetical protein
MCMAASGRPLSPHALGIASACRYRHIACISRSHVEVASPSVEANHLNFRSTPSFQHHDKSTLARARTYTILTEQHTELGLRLPTHAPPIVICNPSLHKHPQTFRRQKTPLPPPPSPIMDSASSMTCRTPCSLTQVSCGGRLSHRRVATTATRQAPAPPAQTATR